MRMLKLILKISMSDIVYYEVFANVIFDISTTFTNLFLLFRTVDLLSPEGRRGPIPRGNGVSCFILSLIMTHFKIFRLEKVTVK